jgi:chorismate lyase / 3-hydroxybenzoate synthase
MSVTNRRKAMSVINDDRSHDVAEAAVDVFYAAAASADDWVSDERVIALLRFGDRTGVDATDPRQISIALPLLGPQELVEVWRTPLPPTRGREGDLVYAAGDEMLFGHLLLDESFTGGIASAAEAGYRRILSTIQALGYPCLVRIWNYFPDINRESDGLERYRAFCVGRYDALAAVGFDEQRLAAASAIGTRGPGLLLYFMAAKAPPIPVDNPRQLSAYRYPPLYGPRSPLFSRAVVKQWGRSTQLYISGTASVVGHLTCHEGDRIEQLRESFRNLEAVVGAARAAAPIGVESPRNLQQLKIYVRDGMHEDLDREVSRLFGADMPRVYLLADICRAALLLEIDAFYSEQSPLQVSP